MYNSVLKISQFTKKANHKEKLNCLVCGNECSGKICSVCNMITRLTNESPKFKYNISLNHER